MIARLIMSLLLLGLSMPLAGCERNRKEGGTTTHQRNRDTTQERGPAGEPRSNQGEPRSERERQQSPETPRDGGRTNGNMP